MKKQQSQPQHKFDQKSLEQLILRKRLADKQLENIKSMNLHQLIDKARKKQPLLPPSPTMNYIRQNYQNSLRAAGFEQNVQEIANKHMQMVEEAERKNIMIRRQMRETPIFSQIKRGKLGLDSIFILFAIIGSVSLPFIFYQKFKKNKQIIIKSRKYSPEVIQNISDDSPIDIDSVSQQSIHYDNPARRRAFEQKMKIAQKITALKKDLDL